MINWNFQLQISHCMVLKVMPCITETGLVIPEGVDGEGDGWRPRRGSGLWRRRRRGGSEVGHRLAAIVSPPPTIHNWHKAFASSEVLFRLCCSDDLHQIEPGFQQMWTQIATTTKNNFGVLLQFEWCFNFSSVVWHLLLFSSPSDPPCPDAKDQSGVRLGMGDRLTYGT